MTAALYLRVSRDSQTVENQEGVLRHFAIQQGWTIVRVYQDVDTGANPDRTDFQRMLADAEKRKFDVLVFWSLDRLTREGALKTLEYLNRLSSWGIGYRSYQEQYLDSCGIFKDAVIAILGSIAQQERARLSERVKAGIVRARSQGRILGRPAAQIDEDRFRKACEQRTAGGFPTWSNAELAELFQIGRTSVYHLKRKWNLIDSKRCFASPSVQPGTDDRSTTERRSESA